jgi:hypothetical protein
LHCIPAVIRIENMIPKNILGVHGRSSNMAIRCELGAFPVVLRVVSVVITFCFFYS